MAYFLPDQDEDSGGGSGERLSSWLGEEQGGTDSTLSRWSQTIQGTWISPEVLFGGVSVGWDNVMWRNSLLYKWNQLMPNGA